MPAPSQAAAPPALLPADPTAVHEDPICPTLKDEEHDVVPDLPPGIQSVQLGGRPPLSSNFYAFGATMSNPWAEQAADPFSTRPSVDVRRSADGRYSVDFRGSIDGRPSIDARGGKSGIDRGISGVIVHDLLHLTSDPRVKQRLMAADSDHDGRISRKDILKVMRSEMSAKHRLKWGLIGGGILLVFCLLMLAANAALTYTVVRMSQETSVQTSGIMTDKERVNIIGTASTAGVVDLLYAHYSPAEASAALLSLKSLLITADNGTAIAVYQVLAATLVPGQRLDFVVTAPTVDVGSSITAAELVRIVIDDTGVHEVRAGTQQAGNRRLLVDATAAGAAKTVQGLVYDVTAPTCSTGTGTCGGTASQISCPEVPSCGADGKLYISPCAATNAGTTVRCTNCASTCTGTGGLPRPHGMPGNLASDGGSSFVRPPPASPPPASVAAGAATAAAAGVTSQTQNQQVKKPASVRRPQNNRKNPPPAKAP